MATEEARVRMTADDADVDAAWKRQFANMQKTEQQLKTMGGAVRQVGKHGEDSFSGMVRGALGLTDALGGTIAILKQALLAQAAWNKERQGQALTRAKAERAFDVATRGRGDKAAVEAAAQAYGVDEDEAWQIGARLADQGVAPGDLPRMVEMQILAGEGVDLGEMATKIRSATTTTSGLRGLKRLGISKDQGASMATPELLQLAAERFGSLGDQERIAAAKDIYGRDWAKRVGPLMRMGPEDARRFQAADATKQGVVVAKDDTTQRDMDRGTASAILTGKTNRGLLPALQGRFAQDTFQGASTLGAPPEYALAAGDWAGGTAPSTLYNMFRALLKPGRMVVDTPAGRVQGRVHPARGLGGE